MHFSKFAAIVLFLLAPPAHAVKDLFSLCERQLTINAENILNLQSDQIAFQGQLNQHWETGMEDQIGWQINDDFLRAKISPNYDDYTHWLVDGDQVFILDENGNVTASGYFNQAREKTLRRTPDGVFEGHLNFPRLYKDRAFTELVMDKNEMTGLFFTNARAVVIHTQTPEQTTAMQTKFKPWFDRYSINAKDVERFVRVGSRRAIEQAHFEVVHKGSLVVEGKTGRAKQFDFATGSFVPGDQYRALKYFLIEGETRLELRPTERIFLLDSKGLVTLEGTVGSPAFPLAMGNLEQAAELEKKIRAGQGASVVRLEFRKLKK